MHKNEIDKHPAMACPALSFGIFSTCMSYSNVCPVKAAGDVFVTAHGDSVELIFRVLNILTKHGQKYQGISIAFEVLSFVSSITVEDNRLRFVVL